MIPFSKRGMTMFSKIFSKLAAALKIKPLGHNDDPGYPKPPPPPMPPAPPSR